jgi:RNA polymerase sigma factor (TIGR02999 family)
MRSDDAERSQETRDTRQLTELLHAWSGGDRQALEELVSLVYGELRQLAGSQMRGERHQTLQPTALVHEAFLRLSHHPGVEWHDRRHFFAVAARIMRRLLVDRARQRSAAKRGGAAPLALSEAMLASVPETARDGELVALDRALSELQRLDPAKAWIVELRFFGGYSLEETADIVGTSRPTVIRQFRLARAWLYRELRPDSPSLDNLGDDHGA